jgi:hypothetical protein
MNAKQLTIGVLVVGLSLAGCGDTTGGQPKSAVPTTSESATPTTSPARTTPSSPTSSPSGASPTAAAPGNAQSLEPHNGYVFIETKSGKTRCQLSTKTVDCEAQFTNAPKVEGEQANGVSVNATGKLSWVAGNLGAIPTVPIDYRTYSAQGWTIVANTDGTRFTNDATGHGMFVSIDHVDSF